MSGRGAQDEHVAGSPALSARVAERDRGTAPVLPLPAPVADRAPAGAAGAPRAAYPANVVILALVAALLDLEQRRNRGKVRPPMDRDRSA